MDVSEVLDGLQDAMTALAAVGIAYLVVFAALRAWVKWFRRVV